MKFARDNWAGGRPPSTTAKKPTCALCGEPMPAGEEMFNYHGYSGPCPKPVKPKDTAEQLADLIIESDLARAAPEMLAVLKRISTSFPGYIPDFVEAVNAVIAKAEGKQVT